MSAGVTRERASRDGDGAGSRKRAAIFAGLGRMGRVLLREAVTTSLFDVVAVVDVNRRAAVDAALTVDPAPRVFGSLHDAVTEVAADCCVIATPSNRHGDDVAVALASGLDVFCEKPLTLQVGQSRRLGRLAADHGLHLQVGLWRRYSKPFRMLRAAAETDLGEIVSVRAVQWDANPPPPSFCDPAVSGGLIVDCGIHEFDMASWIGCQPIGEPSVFPGGGRYADDVRVEVLGTRGAAFLQTVPTWSLTTRLADGVVRHMAQEPGEPDAFVSGVRTELAAFALRNVDEFTPGAEASATALEHCLAATRVLRASPVAG